jgi:YVTN family beta-propeller protein
VAGVPLGIAVNPAGDRLYVVNESGLCVVDAIARAQLGPAISPTALPASVGNSAAAIFPGDIAVSPDGGLIYLTLGLSPTNSVLAIGSGALDQVARGLRTLQSADVRSVALSGTSVAAMALSPDGGLLYVAMEPSTEVSVIDTASMRAGNPIGVVDQPCAIDFTPDGKFALVLTSGDDTRLHLLDTAAQIDSGPIVVGTDFPVAVVASPDGTRGYVLLSPAEESEPLTAAVGAGGGTLVPVELRTRQPDTAIPIDTFVDAMAITPQGDYVYVIGGGTGIVTVVPVGERTPAEWFVTSGTPATPAKVLPVCFGGSAPVDLAVAFAQSLRPFQPNTVAAGLSQVVPASGPCSFEFSFFGYSDDSGALAEIFWLDQKSTLLRTDSLPFQVQPATDAFVLKRRDFTPAAPLILHRAHFNSPDGAAQAEVRFSAPPFTTVLMGQVSLMGTPEALTNGDLQLLQNGLPAGWTLTTQSSRGVSLSPIDGGMRLANFSAGNAELVQSTAIGSNQQYVWELKGSPKLALAQPPPAAELRWLKADGSAAGPSTLLPLDAAGFLRYPASGTTPAGTTTVEIHLKTPPGTGLDIYQVSLQTPQTATVPLSFISQAPGELRVSRSLVTYDVVPVPPPPVPFGGLATPTAPGAKPGDPPCTAWCSCCGDDQPITQPKSNITPAGRPMTTGFCRVCGSPLARPGGPLAAGAPLLHLPILAPHRTVAGRPAFLRPSTPLPPLTALAGIREGRLRQLAEVGISSLEHLADAAPDLVAKAMRGISLKHATGFIERARELVASHRRSSATTRSDPAPPPSAPVSDSQKEN